MRAVLMVAAFALAAGPSLGGPDEEPAAEAVEEQDPIAAPDQQLERYWALSDSLGALVADASGVDEVVLLEAEEMAGIADELFLEGDPETAADLLVAAIQLLEPGRGG